MAGISRYIKKLCGEGAIVVIESTNGLLDGPLKGAGLRIFRADPWVLSERPTNGSVSAIELAVRATMPNHGLVELGDSGTLHHRIQEHEETIRASASTAQDLAARGAFVESCPGGTRRVSLTFDDGPNQPYTDRVLSVLGEYGVPATFFCVGLNAQSDPATVERIAAAGHSIGNHTWSHPFLPDLGRKELEFQLDATNRALAEVTGSAPRTVRTPYGSRTPDSLNWIADRDMTTVLWDIDTQDWANPGVDAIVRSALIGIGDGSVVLMHDGGGDRSQTVSALPSIIESLLNDGFELVTIDHMLAAR
ncbi:polysaccharide deacetylase family protein [Streptomyces sp. NPDC088270]|uniref:polysaccharide deacetylase family protein n=1 Tax=Streptomyces sp. NPDC088270 TaxID=3160990 RepID=UPI00342F9ACA